jgi:hypothetical protein
MVVERRNRTRDPRVVAGRNRIRGPPVVEVWTSAGGVAGVDVSRAGRATVLRPGPDASERPEAGVPALAVAAVASGVGLAESRVAPASL